MMVLCKKQRELVNEDYVRDATARRESRHLALELAERMTKDFAVETLKAVEKYRWQQGEKP
jgi:hypothetical protein